MIFIPIKWMPYVLIVLGIGGAVLVAMSNAPDKVFGVVVCVLTGIGGMIWAAVNILKSKRDKK